MPTIGYTGSGSNGSVAVDPGDTFAFLKTMPQNGWITELHAIGEGANGTVDYRMGIWDASRTRLFSGTTRNWADASNTAKSETGLAVAIPAGSFWMGVHRNNTGGTGDWLVLYTNGNAGVVTSRDQTGADNIVPNPLGGSQNTNDAPLFYAEYIANVAPSTPTWHTDMPTSGSAINLDPVIKGMMNQGADAAYDTIDEVQLVITIVASGVTHSTTSIFPTSTEKANGFFNRTLSTTGAPALSANTAYKFKFRTRDSWDVWSAAYSNERTWTTPAGSNAPTPIGPVGKQNTLTPSYTATHSHPSGTATNAAQVIITNNAGVALYDSGTVTDSTANGATITVTNAEFATPPTLEWGTDYKWKMRVRDTGGVWSPYIDPLISFYTNHLPTTTNLSPQEGQTLSTSVFSAEVKDADGDDIFAAQIDIVRVSTGVAVVTQAAMTQVTGTQTWTYAATIPTLDQNYRYRTRARDTATATYGAWSDWTTYFHSVVPEVQLIAPAATRTNLISQPSAEYDPTDLSAYWTATVGGTGQALARVQEDNAPYGVYAWQATGNASGNIDQTTTNFITIDATKAYSFFTWARTTSGTPLFSFQVLCYDSSNNLVTGGTIRPSSLRDSNAITPPTTWTRYGGIVSQIGGTATAFPTGTVKIKIRVLQTSSTGVLQFDAFSMSQLPYNPDTGTDPNQRLRAQEWLGYADGDYEGFGDNGAKTVPYSWTGIPGDSSSSILPILDAATGGSVVINFPTGTKTGDRLVIEKFVNNAWDEIADTNPDLTPTAGGAREIIPLPSNKIENEGRYRLWVSAANSLGQWGTSLTAEFDVYYVGPAQIDIVIAESFPSKAQNRIVWNPSALSPSVFGGIEVQRIDLGGEEDTQIIGVETDQGAIEFIDHYPASGREYRYRVRQKEIVGDQQVGGFWSSADITCDYVYNFIKDVADPDLFTAYDTEAQNLVGYSEDAPVGMLSPWGAARPTVLQRWKLRTRTGEVVAGFFPDAGIEYTDFPDADTRFDRASRIMKRRQTIAILLPYPEPTKVFAAIIGEARTTFPYPPRIRGVEFGWQEVSWSEDYYERAAGSF